MYLIVDIKRGVQKYLTDLETSIQLQKKYERFQSELDSYRLKDY